VPKGGPFFNNQNLNHILDPAGEVVKRWKEGLMQL